MITLNKAQLTALISLATFGLLAAPAQSHEAEALAAAKRVQPPAGAILELDAVRAATERFRDVNQALAENYVDIGVFMPNMGHHYLKEELLDGVFDASNPELLVYAEDPCGGLRLVAVEYAVPLAASAKAPNGFSGNADVWDRNTKFGLWTLHAWIWEHNVDGVFAPFNPSVP